MSREQWRVFGATGTVHLVAISGLHVTLFAWLAALQQARRAWRLGRARAPGASASRSPQSPASSQPPPTALLAGFGGADPAHAADACRVVARAAAAAASTAAPGGAGPGAARGAGARSAGAARGGVLAVVRRDRGAADGRRRSITHRRWRRSRRVVSHLRWRSMLRELLVTQWRVTLALAPATLALFGSVPLAGLVANLLAIPFFSLAAGAAGAGRAGARCPGRPALAALAAWRGAEQAYVLAWPLFEAMADLPWADLERRAGRRCWLPAGRAGVAAASVASRLRCGGPCSPRWLPLLVTALDSRCPPGHFVATVLDAGDGVALLVATRATRCSTTRGRSTAATERAPRRGAAGAAQPRACAHLDLVVSEPRQRVSRRRRRGQCSPAPRWRTRRSVEVLARRPARRAARLRHGARGWQWDGVELRVFPAGDDRGGSPSAGSCVLRVRADGGALLLPAHARCPGGAAPGIHGGGIGLRAVHVHCVPTGFAGGVAPRPRRSGAIGARLVAQARVAPPTRRADRSPVVSSIRPGSRGPRTAPLSGSRLWQVPARQVRPCSRRHCTVRPCGAARTGAGRRARGCDQNGLPDVHPSHARAGAWRGDPRPGRPRHGGGPRCDACSGIIRAPSIVGSSSRCGKSCGPAAR